MRALLKMAGEIEFHATAAISAVERALASSATTPDWAALYSVATHAGCVSAFLDESASRRKLLSDAFPGRAKSFIKFTAVDEDLSQAKGVRDAIIHSDERLEEEWIRRTTSGQNPEEIEIRGIGRLPSDGRVIINWDPSRFELSGRSASKKDAGHKVEYSTVKLVELRGQLQNVETGISRLGPFVDEMIASAPGWYPPPQRIKVTESPPTNSH